MARAPAIITGPRDLIATVDASKAFSDDVHDLVAYDDALIESLRTSGFGLLDVSGLPQARRFEDIFSWAEGFFGLPANVKRKSKDLASFGERGYTGPEDAETAVGHKKRDNKEYLMFGEPFHPNDRGTWAYPANAYPDSVPGFGPACATLIQEARTIQKEIARVALHHPIARAFGYDLKKHDARLRRADSPLRFLYYPADPTVQPGEIVGGAHTDINCVTLLPSTQKHNLRGLELKLDGQWMPVTVQPGQEVANLGDIYQEFLHYQLASTQHRVVCVDNASPRYSIPFFDHFRKDEIVGMSPAFPGEPMTEERMLDRRLVNLGIMPRKAFSAKHGSKYLKELKYDKKIE